MTVPDLGDGKMNAQLPEQESKNAQVIAALRETFEPVFRRLTSEIEPAIIYVPALSEPAPKETEE
ncbi:MAG: hypothetical protein ACRD4O_12205 [Bryobacteraceae bacterium]